VEFVELNFDFHPRAVQNWLGELGFSIERILTLSHFRVGFLKHYSNGNPCFPRFHLPVDGRVVAVHTVRVCEGCWGESGSREREANFVHIGVFQMPRLRPISISG